MTRKELKIMSKNKNWVQKLQYFMCDSCLSCFYKMQMRLSAYWKDKSKRLWWDNRLIAQPIGIQTYKRLANNKQNIRREVWSLICKSVLEKRSFVVSIVSNDPGLKVCIQLLWSNYSSCDSLEYFQCFLSCEGEKTGRRAGRDLSSSWRHICAQVLTHRQTTKTSKIYEY